MYFSNSLVENHQGLQGVFLNLRFSEEKIALILSPNTFSGLRSVQFNKSLDNLVFVADGSFPAHKAFVDPVQKPLYICYGYHFSLAVKVM